MFEQRLKEIINSLTAALEDSTKFDQQNDAAGKRLRAACQLTRTDLQALRLDIQAERNQRKNS